MREILQQPPLSDVKQWWQRIKTHKLATNAGLYVSGNVLQKGVALLLLPVWARFLTPLDYGVVGTLAAFSAVLLTLFVMGLQGAAVRYFYDYSGDTTQQKKFISSIVLFQMVLPGFVLLALNIWGPSIWDYYVITGIPFDPYVRLMIWSTYAASLLQIPLALYRAQQRANVVVYAQYGQFLITIISHFVFLVGLRLGAHGLLLSQLIAGFILAAILMHLLIRHWFTWQVNWKYIQTGMTYGLPLVPHLIADCLMQLGDRIILERFVSLPEIGLYSLGYMLGGSMGFIVAGINQAWAPYYFRLMTSDPDPDEKIIKIVTVYVATISGICLLGVLFAGELVFILLPNRFQGAIPYVAPVLVAHLMTGFYYFAVAPIYYHKKTKLIPLLTCAGATLNILLNFLLIPRFGAIAAAWTTMVSNSFIFFIFFLVSRKYQKINYPLWKYGMVVLAVIISALMLGCLDTISLRALMAKIVVVMIYLIMIYQVFIGYYHKLKSRNPII